MSFHFSFVSGRRHHDKSIESPGMDTIKSGVFFGKETGLIPRLARPGPRDKRKARRSIFFIYLIGILAAWAGSFEHDMGPPAWVARDGTRVFTSLHFTPFHFMDPRSRVSQTGAFGRRRRYGYPLSTAHIASPRGEDREGTHHIIMGTAFLLTAFVFGTGASYHLSSLLLHHLLQTTWR